MAARIFKDPKSFQAECTKRGDGETLGLVPTMGALHEGHLSLVRAARRANGLTAVSVFVNPTQFGPNEDLARYPRPFERDAALLESEGVDLIFAPEADAMYVPGERTRVDVDELSGRLDGGSRPGHFRGVATVVLKLFQLAQPTRAYFGQKDAAQVAVIRRMTADLFLPLEIVVCPIVREADGVAMSSRNAYLSASERHDAQALSRSLRAIGDAYEGGERDCKRLLAAAQPVLDVSPLRLDYLAAVDGDTLVPLERAIPGTLFAVAAYAGGTRLIDNAHLDAAGRFSL